MAIIESKYTVPFFFRNKHLATILPSMYRKVEVTYVRERLELKDGDFVDVDWLGKGRDKVIVLTHGLEGSSQRHYITAIAKYFYERGWGVAAWNCRSCSGEMNRLPRLYSHIDAPDLAEVVDFVSGSECQKIALAGISMGGVITLNYLIEHKDNHPESLIGAVAISTPVDVQASAQQLDLSANQFYLDRFMKKMIKRVKEKADQFPGIVDLTDVDEVTSFNEYDRRFTKTMTDCLDIDDFYTKANTLDNLASISLPTLLLISKDDPFMPASCYPIAQARHSKFFDLEVTNHGGHTGFMMNFLRDSWMERRTYEYLDNLV